MYRKTYFLYYCGLIFSMLCGLSAMAQGQLYNERIPFINANKVWTFGRHAGLDFNFNPARAFESAVNTFVSSASLSSPATGQLQFYSQGNSCFNRDHKPMPNGSGLLGNPFNNGQRADGGTWQGVCILPSLEKPGQYYLFSLGATNAGTYSSRLYYSIVDTILDRGYGDIIPGKKNLLLDQNLSECMIGIPGNNCDLWLLLHDNRSARFKAYHIDYRGISSNPVISDVGVAGCYNLAALTVSPDRKMLSLVASTASILPGSVIAGLQLFRFDPETGMVSDGLSINNKWTSSSCFSPDGKFLYVNYNDTNTSSIVQYELATYSAAAVRASETVIDTFRRNESRALKLYDGKVYVSMMSSGNLGQINNPNRKGLACDFQRTGLALGTNREARFGLSAEVVLPFPKDTIHTTVLDTLICSSTGSQNISALALAVRPLSGLFIWDNGSTEPVRTVKRRGKYWVFYKGDCHSYIDSFIVGGSDFTFDLGPDTTVCAPENFSLSAEVPGSTSYLWQDGSAGQRYDIYQSGKYWLSIAKDKCILTDTVRVRYLNVMQDLGADTAICNDVRLEMRLEARIPPEPGTRVLWNTGLESTTIDAREFGTYWVEVRNERCLGVDTITIAKVSCSCRVDVPTAFSPNHDGLNDIFLPQIESGCVTAYYTLSIFNRWGQRIFLSSSPDAGWDGTFNGIPADIGTYFYALQFEGSIYKTKYTRKGDLTLIR